MRLESEGNLDKDAYAIRSRTAPGVLVATLQSLALGGLDIS
jgi:hypothetical protein